MDSNTYSTGQPAGLAALTAAVEELAAQDLDGLTGAARAERVLELRAAAGPPGRPLAPRAGHRGRPGGGRRRTRPPGRLHRQLAASPAADGCRRRPHQRPDRPGLFRGPLTQTARALTDGELSPAHASVLAAGTQELPDHVTVEAEPVLVEAARRLDPPRLRQVLAHLREVIDPDTTTSQAERRHARRGLWLSATLEGMLEPEAGQILVAALEPLARRQ